MRAPSNGSSAAVVAPIGAPPPSWAPPPGFDGYRLGALIGKGAMGEVYLAQDELLERPVAVKFLLPAKVSQELRSTFLGEARALARLQHPNVVAVYRAGEVAGHPYLAYELVRGESLAQRRKPVGWREALDLGLQLARGLGAAHRRGVLHCDLKPANVLVGEGGELKLVDFGLARLATPPPRAGEGRAEEPIGTPAYMAPEVWAGSPPTTRSDVYSAGALLYELMVGHPPHLDGDVAELSAEIASLPLEPMASCVPGVDQGFAEVVERCLKIKPELRFASGEELAGALGRLASRRLRGPFARGNPYRGLQAFQVEHRAVFFGREAEAQALIERLRSEPVVVVVADSGVGKSSLCRAGVLPELSSGALGSDREWRGLSVSPGLHPLASLAGALATFLEADEEALSRAIAADPQAAAREIRGRLGRLTGLLLFVDQLEELATLSRPEEAKAASELLGWLTAGGTGIRLLATLRSDFLTRVAALPGLGAELGRTLFLLKPLSQQAIREAVVGPAAISGASFESEELVRSLVEAGSSGEGGLPLLQFALSELWEHREPSTGVLTLEALEKMGGVVGALARHADGVFGGLSASQASAARRMLPLFVTLEGTRAHRSERELLAGDGAAREVLDALVRARLLVASEGRFGSSYEVAHEALIQGWPTLRRWLEEDADQRAARERLSKAAADWLRLGRRGDGLWGKRLLREASSIDPAGLLPEEIAFLEASRRALRRRKVGGLMAAFASALLALAGYVAIQARAQGEFGRRLDRQVEAARASLASAHELAGRAALQRAVADQAFERDTEDQAEEAFEEAQRLSSEAGRRFAQSTQLLEAAWNLDRSRDEVREWLADALVERVLFLDSAAQPELMEELRARLELVDPSGVRSQRLSAPGLVRLRLTPAAAVRVRDRDGRLVEERPVSVEALLSSPPGSYLLEARAPGFGEVRLPLLLGRAERLDLAVELPAAAEVPEGFVHVPAGRFLTGARADEALRKDFLKAPPLRAAATPTFLIARYETTYAEWISFLESLPEAERVRRTARVGRAGDRGSLLLTRSPKGWQLILRPTEEEHLARAGERIRYRERGSHADQDWLRFPVTGIGAEDAEAYAAWLGETGRVPKARLCTELEWERAARGADGRPYPHGESLRPEDANFDETYGKKPEAFGPDEVGSHRRSDSVFGVSDMSGNAFEWTRSARDGEYVARGGSYYYGRNTARLDNREVTEPSLRDLSVGVRICADPSR
ncbi:MAG: SUMF1/EgtB/PvdO family nonheme iron enzyme [Myxococcales bacterium]|nr:SUMF1/EgtB/PvdO family nonheme iron enzyme [Myxococcales bacterium]